MTAEKYIEILKPFVPEGTAPGLLQWLEEHHAKLTITRKRHTKTGDYRPPLASLPINEGVTGITPPFGGWGVKGGAHFHRITINHNLKPYSFLLTLLHEMAHLMTWTLHGKKAKSHGLEWNHELRKLMIPYFEKNVFPQPVQLAIEKHLGTNSLLNRRVFASNCSDSTLIRALREVEAPKDLTGFENLSGLIHDGMSPLTTGRKTIFVEDIPDNGNFIFRNHIFNKVARVRKRYKCIEVNSKKEFLFSPVAEVVPV